MSTRVWIRWSAASLLALLYLLTLPAGWIAPWPYDRQFREAPSSPPSHQFPLGTDELGRDRLSRLIVGARVSLWMAPAAALVAVGLAAVLGAWAAAGGRWIRPVLLGSADLTLCIPGFFLLLALRSVLPLDVAPAISVAVTFGLLGLLGWAAPARVVYRAAGDIFHADYVCAARARGVGRLALVLRYLVPNLLPVLMAEFWICIPLFLIAEANLGMLGLGVTEPLPSWGGLLKDLESLVATGSVWSEPWRLAPLAALAVTVAATSLLSATRVRT